jgi:F420-non-reducing hydrogenase large subunit
MNKVTIDPITRLEGHGKIVIFLDDAGDVANVYFQIPELRGFEQFCLGRPVEEMSRITTRICGVCPEAHHMASAKAQDAVYKVEIPPAARLLRELLYNVFFVTDHAVHFYILAGPDFICGPTAPKAERNIVGVLKRVGIDVVRTVIENRARCERVIEYLGGKGIHQVTCIAGGIRTWIKEEDLGWIREYADKAVEFAQFTIKIFHDVVLANQKYVDMILSDPFTQRTYYMGLVDQNNHPNFYDGDIRVVDPEGREHARFKAHEYTEYIAEHVEPYSYLKYPYLKKVGWKGFVDGVDSGVYCASPLSRLNVADGMSTPIADAEYKLMYETLGGKPVHHTLATHWARVIELCNAAERWREAMYDPLITSKDVFTVPTETPSEGVGVVEAPRGTLYHHYCTDENGMLTRANLIVGTTNNNAAITMSLKRAAQGVISAGTKVDDGLLNIVEMAFRSYDPCFGCATHSLPGDMPLEIELYDAGGKLIRRLRR